MNHFRVNVTVNLCLTVYAADSAGARRAAGEALLKSLDDTFGIDGPSALATCDPRIYARHDDARKIAHRDAYIEDVDATCCDPECACVEGR